ncbi:oxidoreductase [Acinetobacter sp. NCu2D-2]|uniref:NADH:flavin oxidoreductase/NADH oxidase n=1 Tax=Acinetobacter sp. NCu2D-2 TaxID=1608473 RepID=UPI0007CDBFB0|nr:NADH:flavin oxidoreductase/NADH oxidase [Acinetobacter sp. NCu2D-2]ANF82405.1 oxidoreductase [Acinetobacter sp. NCu2D-2]
MAQLFQPIHFASLELKNRIVIAPMCQYSANTDAEVTYWHEQQWANYALSGAGLCIVEATAVQPNGRISDGDIGLWNDQQATKIKDLLNKIQHISPMPFAVQLAHAGRKASVDKPWTGKGQIAPHQARGWQTVAPSDIAFQLSDHPPLALSEQEIQTLIQDFAASAKRAVDAGFALIEIHAAHGYLLHQFLSPLSNHRQDNYGGCLENRMRLVLEVVQAIKAVVPEGYPVGVRISATDWMDQANGWDVESSIQLAKALEQLDVAYIHVSTAGLHPDQNIAIGPNYQVPHAAAIKKVVQTPVIAVGLITQAQQAEDILVNEHADAIGIARAILFNPRWPWLAAAELGEQIEIAPQYLRCQPHEYKKLFTAFSE